MRKRTKIYLWLSMLTLISVSIFLLSHISMSKEQAIDKMISACTRNTPFDPVWTKELGQMGIPSPTEEMAGQYCNCFYNGMFDNMDKTQIVNYANASREERETILGGRQKINAKHNQCLQPLKP